MSAKNIKNYKKYSEGTCTQSLLIALYSYVQSFQTR